MTRDPVTGRIPARLGGALHRPDPTDTDNTLYTCNSCGNTWTIGDTDPRPSKGFNDARQCRNCKHPRGYCLPAVSQGSYDP